ncbi:hypothetical protein DRQ09_09340, partial [candidate division KSB1 bacterium]
AHFLLYLPVSSETGKTSYIDSLFTSTSAVCVTGLIVVDTGKHYSAFGEAVILILIQIGGLGFMTVSTFLLFLLKYRVSLSYRKIITDTYLNKFTFNIKWIILNIILFTFFIEFLGALLLFARFISKFPLKTALWNSVFHSVSAFCNAGFSLFSTSFINFQGDWLVNLTLIFLIISGGLGFAVLIELWNIIRRKTSWDVVSLHTKIVIHSVIILVVFGSVCFFFFEYRNILAGHSLSEKFFISIFQVVTPRTAGFNTVKLQYLSNVTLFLLIILMFIGAGSGSCGGGIKINTAFVIGAFLRARLQNMERVQVFKKQISENSISKAISVFLFSGITIFVFVIVLMYTQLGEVSYTLARGKFLEFLFECTSAFGTVGLSMGVTSILNFSGKLLVVILMFIGRIGPLTIAFLFSEQKREKAFAYPEETVIVG